MQSEVYGTDEHELLFIDSLKESINFNYVEKWQSQWNPHMIYDAKPKCTDGYTALVQFEGDEPVVNYVIYLCNQRTERISKLDEILLKTET